jgi:hypothetical protein
MNTAIRTLFVLFFSSLFACTLMASSRQYAVLSIWELGAIEQVNVLGEPSPELALEELKLLLSEPIEMYNDNPVSPELALEELRLQIRDLASRSLPEQNASELASEERALSAPGSSPFCG